MTLEICLSFLKKSRSNETGIEHVAKNYHGLHTSDVELLVDCLKNPIEHVKDRRYPKTYCYYILEGTIILSMAMGSG